MHAFWQGIYSFVHVLLRHVRSHWICWHFSPPTAFCDFSVIFHQIFLIFCQYEENQLCISCIHFCVWRSKVKVTFGWSVVLDKGTTCYKFWGHRLKVKVMRRQPLKISCTLFSSPEPKARVSYCHSAPSVVRPSAVVVRP